jgi:hypothetical protein
MRGMAAEGCCVKTYRSQQVVRITQEGIVAAPEDGEACIGQLPVPQGVVDLVESMDAAVQVDHEVEPGTQEVSD